MRQASKQGGQRATRVDSADVLPLATASETHKAMATSHADTGRRVKRTKKGSAGVSVVDLAVTRSPFARSFPAQL